METVNIGIIGCASVVEKHIAKALHNVKNGKVITIASRNPDKAKQWAKRFCWDFEKSYDDVISRKDVDAIYVPLPVAEHKEWVIKAAKAKKHILCEKSLGENLTSVKAMVESCKKNKVILYEDFMCDYHPQHKKVMSLIAGGKIGELFLFSGFFGFPPLDKWNIRYKKALGGGSLNDAGAYPIFMSRKILRSEPLSVTSRLVYHKNLKVDIRGSAYLEFPKNKVAIIAFGFNNMYQNSYSLWGSTGTINVKRAYSIPADMKPELELMKEGTTEKIEIPAANHFSLIFEDFCNRILQNRKIDYSNLIYQAIVMEAIRISARENRKVKIFDVV